MMEENAAFLAQLDEMIARIEELDAALADLPRDIVITIRYEEIGRPDVLGAETQTISVNRVFVGNEGNIPPAIQYVREVQGNVDRNLPTGVQNVLGNVGDISSQISNIDAEAAALRNLNQQYAAGEMTTREYIAVKRELAATQFMEANMAARLANAQAQSTDAITAWWQETNKATPDGAAFATTMAMAAAAILRANNVLAPFTAATRSAGASLAAIPIATGLAAFGITSLGTAIHLVVMGVAEFLAVFLPAMYAAAAGAYVMMQGTQNVVQHVTGLYTAAEALGPMLNTTAGDMLGLGHSIQTAQNLANPGVYTLFGEAIGAINAYSGRATLGLNGLKLTAAGAAGGLTSFSQVGLDVTHMLDAFGAKVVADLQGPLGGTLHQLVSSATNDLRAFGQIIGNLGHAIVNLAADMPGLAGVILHVIAGFTALINWVSQLPHGLITAIFVIEEMYRWSGLLAGVFGMLGRGIALVGTLGIPVFAAIGRNVATMAANVIAGVSNMIGNFGMLLSKTGLIGSEGVQNIARFRNVLATAVDFLSGPWGVAIGLAVVAAGAFIFALSRMKTATQAWIDTAQQAVSKASNLQVLNVIANQMQVSTQKIADANNQVQRSQADLTDTQMKSAAASKQVGSSYSNMVQDINKASMAEQGYQVQRQKSNIAIDQAQTSINQLTSYQRQLVMEGVNVVSGASQISKAYGVDFTTALGLADMAGVKLASSIGKNGQLTAQAAIQIGALYLGYQKMDQTGGILANSMNAVNIQAGLQSTKVSQLNQAWDQFIQMGTGLTGTYTQLNLDIAQMGNSAQLVGSKVNAFTGTTQLSVNQIASSLKSFGSTSAQTWQAYNSSITQANSFTDSLRIAAAAGVVSQGQYKQAIASVVGQLLPYASQSKAALAELTMIAQEAGGPAYNSTKSLTSNYQDLKNWTDQTGVSSGKFSGIINTLTEKLTNVSAVARTFAGTLQSDVLNAMASAAADTTKITQLTDNYTRALQNNQPQSSAVKQAQDALTSALEKYEFKATDITQMENILTTAYGKNQNASSTLSGQTDKTRSAFEQYSNQLGINKSKADDLWNDIAGKGVSTFNVLHSNTDLSRTKFEQLASQLGITKGAADNLWTALHRIPPTTSTTLQAIASGKGGVSITASGLAAKEITLSKLAAGGKITGGTTSTADDVLIRASRGETVISADHSAKLAPLFGAMGVPGYAAGGLVGQTDLPSAIGRIPPTVNQTVNADIAAEMAADLKGIIAGIKNTLTQQATSIPVKGGAGYAAFRAAAIKALALTHTPLSWLNDLSVIALYESGYNPNAINLTDSNAAAGDPSRGYMQTIMTTFDANHQAGTSWNIYDPVANIAAAINYIKRTYGSVFNVPGIVSISRGGGYVGYDNGGWLMPGLTMALNNTGSPERVLSGNEELTASAPIQVNVHLDGKQIWTAMQQQTFKYNMRNRGQITGGVSPLNK